MCTGVHACVQEVQVHLQFTLHIYSNIHVIHWWVDGTERDIFIWIITTIPAPLTFHSVAKCKVTESLRYLHHKCQKSSPRWNVMTETFTCTIDMNSFIRTDLTDLIKWHIYIYIIGLHFVFVMVIRTVTDPPTAYYKVSQSTKRISKLQPNTITTYLFFWSNDVASNHIIFFIVYYYWASIMQKQKQYKSVFCN